MYKKVVEVKHYEVPNEPYGEDTLEELEESFHDDEVGEISTLNLNPNGNIITEKNVTSSSSSSSSSPVGQVPLQASSPSTDLMNELDKIDDSVEKNYKQRRTRKNYSR